MAGLTSYIYNDASRMWQEIESRLDEKSVIVVPNALARTRLLEKRFPATVWQRQVRTVYDIRQKVNSDAAELAPVLLPLEMNHHLSQLLKDKDILPELARLGDYPEGLDRLVKHLANIDARADQRYQPTNAIEDNISLLRDKIKASGYISTAMFSTETARQAKNFRLPGIERMLIIVPGQPDPMLTGLFKGLAVGHDVDLFMLSSADSYKLLLKQGLIDQLPYQTDFIDKSDIDLFWLQDTSQSEAILDAVAALLDQGIASEDIAIASAADPNLWEELEQGAARRQLPLLVRTQVDSKTSALGTLIVILAERYLSGDLGREDIAGHFPVDEQAQIELAAQLDDNPSFNQRLEVFNNFGQRLLEEKDPLIEKHELDQEWLAGLQYFIRDHKLDQGNLVETLTRIKGAQRLRGQGVVTLGYSEASAYSCRWLICGSLERNQYPRPSYRSPFISEELLRAVERMKDPDLTAEFASALMTASDGIIMVRPNNESGPSPYWLKAISLLGQEDKFADINIFADDQLPQPERSKSTRRERQRMARQRISEEQVDRLLSRTAREKLPQGALQGGRNNYSVTELETFLRCPRGWFVSHVLKPRQRPSERAELGTRAHKILEKTISLAPNERQAEIARLVAASNLSPHNQALMEKRLLEVSDRYGNPSWPLMVEAIEQRFTLTLPSGHSLTGKADRIDLDGQGRPLILDYKLGKKPGGTVSKTALQHVLYPIMAGQHYNADPLGLLYVSIRFVDHDGILTEVIDGVDDRFVSYKWREAKEKALGQVEQAIADIEAGLVLDVGDNCPEWCSHQLISQTIL